MEEQTRVTSNVDEASVWLREQLFRHFDRLRTRSLLALTISVLLKVMIVVLLWQFFVVPKLGERGRFLALALLPVFVSLQILEPLVFIRAFKRWRW